MCANNKLGHPARPSVLVNLHRNHRADVCDRLGNPPKDMQTTRLDRVSHACFKLVHLEHLIRGRL